MNENVVDTLLQQSLLGLRSLEQMDSLEWFYVFSLLNVFFEMYVGGGMS